MTSKVLVILDDDQLFLEAAERHLTKELEIVTFGNPETFIDFVAQNASAIDLLCIDLNMHDLAGVKWTLGGLHVILELRNLMGEDTPKVCAITGMDKTVHIDMCMRHGADDFIEKGDTIGAFADQVKERLQLAA